MRRLSKLINSSMRTAANLVMFYYLSLGGHSLFFYPSVMFDLRIRSLYVCMRAMFVVPRAARAPQISRYGFHYRSSPATKAFESSSREETPQKMDIESSCLSVGFASSCDSMLQSMTTIERE